LDASDVRGGRFPHQPTLPHPASPPSVHPPPCQQSTPTAFPPSLCVWRSDCCARRRRLPARPPHPCVRRREAVLRRNVRLASVLLVGGADPHRPCRGLSAAFWANALQLDLAADVPDALLAVNAEEAAALMRLEAAKGAGLHKCVAHGQGRKRSLAR
jgi:hypothetical protein